MRVLNKFDEQGNPLSLEEWCVLMNIQNSEANRTVPLTVWEHIKVCIIIFYYLYVTKYYLKICCFVLSTGSVTKQNGDYDFDIIAALLVCTTARFILFISNIFSGSEGRKIVSH
jgi:hypothetical protein